MRGKVKRYFEKKGYGFIQGDDGQDYFFHYTSVPEGIILKEGDEVSFDPIKTEKGLQAKNVNVDGEEDF